MAQKQVQKAYSVPALEKAIMILNALIVNELSISDISAQLGIPKSTTFVILNTLEQHSIAEKTEDGRFRLGYGVFRWGMGFYNSIDIVKVARPHLQRLVSGTPFTAHVAVLINLNPVYIDKVEGDGFVRFATSIGQRLPLHLSGVGKALASGLSDEEILRALPEVLDAPTAKSHRSVEEVFEDIQFVREQGFSIEDEQFEEGIRCIGAPIYGFNKKVIASFSITALSKDLPAVKFHSMGKNVKDTAQQISKELGYQG